MKSLTSKFASARGWALLLILFLGAGLFVVACGDEEVPTPTTPAPTPPAPPPAPPPEPEPTPEPPAVPVGLRISASGVDFIEWSWSAVEGVSGYDVQYSANEAFTGEDEEIARTAEQISYRRENLEAETSHYVRVRSAAGTGDGRVTSGWSTHVTGMTAAAPPVAPAAPTNLKVGDSGEDFIEWTWDRVAGAAGYIAQFSTDSRFGAGDPAFTVEGVANTKHKVSNLEADSDGYLRVRAYVGAAAEPTLGDWTEGAKGTTEEASAPVTTALSAPTGLDTGSETTTRVTLIWDEVDDADSYDVEQRPAGGSWTGASCNGGGSQVNIEECEASGLTRGTDYTFRVRANPDPDDETLESSGWSSTASARTSGTPPGTSITGGDDDLNITWESDNTSITWFWDPPSDNRISYLFALLRGMEKTPTNTRPTCPALTLAANQDNFEDIKEAKTPSSGWYGGPSGFPEFARTLSKLGLGDVRGLCVVRTWMDDQDNRQYGPVSAMWATTAPEPPGAAKETEEDGKTTLLEWEVTMDEGFTYEVSTAKALYATSSNLGSCPDNPSQTESFTTNRDGGKDKFEIKNPDAFTQYNVCVRASNKAPGESGWTDVATQFTTRPAAPPSLSGKVTEASSEDGKEQTTVETEWSFSVNDKTPEDANSYNVSFHTNNKPSPGIDDNFPALKGKETCSGSEKGKFSLKATHETSSGFKFTLPTIEFDRAAKESTRSSRTGRVLVCVRAERSTNSATGSTHYGPWSSKEVTVSVPKQKNSG